MSIHKTICPGCGNAVSYEWNNGIVSKPDMILVADWIYHWDCWGKIEDELYPKSSFFDGAFWPWLRDVSMAIGVVLMFALLVYVTH